MNIDLAQRPLMLYGSRISLVSLHSGNWSSNYRSWLNRPETNRFLEVRHRAPFSADTVASYVEQQFSSSSAKLLGIFLLESGEHIGNIRFELKEHHRTAEIGYLIGETSKTGQGLATEAVALLTGWLLSELGIRKISAGVYESNVASQRVLEKAGFEREACLRLEVLNIDGKIEDVYRYSKFAEFPSALG